MLVKKEVFNLHELDCTLDQVKEECANHFYNLVNQYVCCVADNSGMSDKDRVLQESTTITLDTNCIRMEFYIDKNYILKLRCEDVYRYNKKAQKDCEENNADAYCTMDNIFDNILEYTDINGKTTESDDYSKWSHKLFIKLIQLGDKYYYFYTI